MSSESWGTALVVLAAVLVGAAIPVLLQLRATLRAMEKTIHGSGPQLEKALGATATTAARIEALVVRLEGTMNQLRDTVRVASAVGAAVGPAVVAAVQAFRADREVPVQPPLQAVENEPAAPTPEPRRQAAP